MPEAGAAARPLRFILLYALAWAGGAAAYTPLLTILLPVQVAGLIGTQQGVGWLAQISLAGALAASGGNILFGYLSDITGNRRLWIAAGLVLSCLLLPLIGTATRLDHLIGLIVVWQLALNMMLAPLAAWAGDRVPDGSKGLLGGLMAFAPGVGALSGAIVTQPGLAEQGERLGLIALIVAACVLPVLLLGARRDRAIAPGEAKPADRNGPAPARHVVVRMWAARLAVQVAEATLFAYLLFWLRSLDASVGENQTARLFSAILLVSAPLALVAGRWSDRADRPLLPLVVTAGLSAMGLLGMAMAGSLAAAMLAYALFGLASAVFLALHSAQTLRVLPRPDRRGRDLGLFNLTNTVPSLIMPWLAIALVPLFGYRALFLILAVLALIAALLLAGVPRKG
ncbi:MAG: MFS transporter [Novosphingobium sp.]